MAEQKKTDLETPASAGSIDRRLQDGEAETGDMLGGVGAGAGDRLGIEAEPYEDEHEFDPGPISGHQHDLENDEPRTDSASTYHGVGEIPKEGA